MRTLNHILSLIAGLPLNEFVPAWAKPSRAQFRGDNMVTATLTPASEWRMLRFISDEEGVQTKAIHYLFSFIGLRGAFSPEVCHPKWNAFKRAARSASMSFDLLRLTLAANYGHGAKITGERATARKQYLREYLTKQSVEYFEDLYEEILQDRGLLASGCCDQNIDPRHLIENIMDSPSVKSKGIYVPHLIHFDCQSVVYPITAQPSLNISRSSDSI